MTQNTKNSVLFGPDPAVEAAAAARLDPQVKTILEGNREKDFEELLLSRIDATPFDLPFLVPVIRHLVKNNKTDAAEMFLDLLFDAYRSRHADREEIALLCALLKVWPEAQKLRETILERCRSAYGGNNPNFDRLVEHCRVLSADEPLAALQRLETWLRYNEGCAVYLASKGVGRVREINVQLDVVRVAFGDGSVTHTFKLDEAARLLEPLTSGHFLLEKLENIASLQALAASDPGELLRRLFDSAGHSLPLAELRDMLSGIISAPQWTAWWTGARKDRRLTVAAGNICTWNNSADNADSAILERFMAAHALEKIDMARKYARRSEGLATAMTAELIKSAQTSEPSLALELLLSLDRLSAKQFADSKNAIVDLLRPNDAAAVVQGVQDRQLRKKAVALIREVREEWPTLYGQLIKTESDSSSLALLYDALRTVSDGRLDDFVTETFSAPAKAPFFFVWLCRELPARPELRPIATFAFLQSLLQVIAKDAMKGHHAALRKLFDEDGPVYLAARGLDLQQARQFIALLERDSSLEDYRREKLLKDLRAWHPETVEVEDKTFFVSPQALKLRQNEFDKLTTRDIPENTEEILKARAHGDLRENFEYHAARARQEMLSSRAKTLHDDLQYARPIDRSKIDPSALCIGTTVRLALMDGGEELLVTLLGPWDSDPARNVLSYLAPAGKSLLGKHVGDQVTLEGKQFLVKEIAIAETELR